MKPKIGIPTPTSIDPAYNQRSWPAYAAAVARAGGDPVEVHLNLPPAELEALAASCHGFLLPGSPADVDPGLYDTPRLAACGPQDAAREQTDFALLTHAAATGKPLLGICYGCQSLNVFHGGSLIQDLSPLPVNHAAGASVAIAHSVVIAPDSTLANLLQASPETNTESTTKSTTKSTTQSTTELGAPLSAQHLARWVGDAEPSHLRLPVNTSHHQSVAVPGRNLRIAARCPDDEVIEAIELDPAMFHVEQSRRFLVGVQWHPERSIDISPASRALFQALITAAQPLPPCA